MKIYNEVTGEVTTLQVDDTDNTNLLNGLHASGIQLMAPCGGKGTCGKCKIKVLEGTLEITSEDKRFFSEQELLQGMRLACQGQMKDELSIAYRGSNSYVKDNSHKVEIELKTELAIAVDIGTTTLGFALVNMNNKEVIAETTVLNRQSYLGADVISRIEKANEGYLHELSKRVIESIQEGITSLVEDHKLQQVGQLVMVGNTTMIHLLLGLSCETLGVHPFTAVTLEEHEKRSTELFPLMDLDVPIYIFPSISTFIGGDILSGLYAKEVYKENDPVLLVDLGTNGEMALGNKKEIITAATAAGPAFEGGNMSSGCGYVTGAIYDISYMRPYFAYETVGGRKPIGLCGSGIMKLIATGAKQGWISTNGRLESPFEDGSVTITENIRVTNKDVQNFLLAKAAIRSGIETLIEESPYDMGDIKKVYLAGGLGTYMDIDSAIDIGLIPEELRCSIISIGNSALQGAIKYLIEDTPRSIKNTRELARAINLAEHSNFEDKFINHLHF